MEHKSPVSFVWPAGLTQAQALDELQQVQSDQGSRPQVQTLTRSWTDFIGKLAALVPPPRVHLTRFFGILGPAARSNAPRNYTWAYLMMRVFLLDVLQCPNCGGRLRLVAAIQPPETTRKIPDCLGLPSRDAARFDRHGGRLLRGRFPRILARHQREGISP